MNTVQRGTPIRASPPDHYQITKIPNLLIWPKSAVPHQQEKVPKIIAMAISRTQKWSFLSDGQPKEHQMKVL